MNFIHNIFSIFHRFHNFIQDEEAQSSSLTSETSSPKHLGYTRMIIITLAVLIIIGMVLIIAQPDDVRINIFSVTRTVNISSADVKPKLPGARTVTYRRNTVNIQPRM